MKRKKIIWNIISIIFTCILLTGLFMFNSSILKLDVLPTKYLIVLYTVLAIFTIILILLMYAKKRNWIRIIGYGLTLILSGIFMIVNTYLNSTNDFFTNTQISDFDTLNYSVIVLNNTYKDLNSLNGKNISYLNDEYKKDIEKKLNSLINYNENVTSEFGLLPDYLLEKKTDAICLEESYYTLIKEEVEDFEEKTKLIYSFEVEVKSHQEAKEEIKISEESFIAYISGVDQYGNVNSVRGRSDVNMIMIVNPKTNHILLVNTPRDYYVQLAGTTGLRDKLTHAGIYGINKSIGTLENLYKIDINYYLRVNFDTLIKVIDVIGGIEIYSDSAHNLRHDKSYKVQVGINKMNGKQALAYARERYSFKDGDHQRGANQQKILTAIIDKVTNSSVIISKYNSILNALNGTFQTDMSTNMITSFIKYQLDKMPAWKVESIAVTGSNSMDYTYSMGTGYKLYVMEPDLNSVATAKQKMMEVLQEE